MTNPLQDTSIAGQLKRLETRLNNLSDTAHIDAQVILAHILEKPRSWLLAHSEQHLIPAQRTQLNIIQKRLEVGEPLPYILGHWEFYGLDFHITHEVLIPRPETELLVEHGIQWLQSHPDRRYVADIGTGSGCIAVTLATKLSDLAVIATDISSGALHIAQRNAAYHSVAERITFIQASLLDFKSTSPFDLICANLPYIPSHSLPSLKVANWEPRLALNGGIDGLGLIRRLLQQAPMRLSSGGLVLLEIEATQGEEILSYSRGLFKDAEVILYPDLAGHDRLLSIQFPK